MTQPGLYELAARDIFKYLQAPQYSRQNLKISVSFFEIYGSDLYDLLNHRNKLVVREDAKQNHCIVGLKEYPVRNEAEIMQLLDDGKISRHVGQTGANDESSRSHAVLQISVKTARAPFLIVRWAGALKADFCDLIEGAALPTLSVVLVLSHGFLFLL